MMSMVKGGKAKMKLTKKDIKAIEELGWSIHIHNDGAYFLENYSPAGCDMVIEDVASKEEIIERCESFDPEEEFNVWYGAHNGEPECPGDLWQDCLDMEEMYDKLKEVLDE